MPTTLEPFKAGPPLFPELMAASIWTVKSLESPITNITKDQEDQDQDEKPDNNNKEIKTTKANHEHRKCNRYEKLHHMSR
jgi:hypothetical protein